MQQKGQAAMSYGDGPNWPMIQARRRAEREANSARQEGARMRAEAAEWQAKFEALAQRVRAAAEPTGAAHREEGGYGCRRCWEALIEQLAQQPQARPAAPGPPGGGTFSFQDLFGGCPPPPRNG